MHLHAMLQVTHVACHAIHHEIQIQSYHMHAMLQAMHVACDAIHQSYHLTLEKRRELNINNALLQMQFYTFQEISLYN